MKAQDPPESDEETAPEGYDAKADERLQRHIQNEQRRIDRYVEAMGNAHNRKSKRDAKKHLRRRGRGFTR